MVDGAFQVVPFQKMKVNNPFQVPQLGAAANATRWGEHITAKALENSLHLLLGHGIVGARTMQVQQLQAGDSKVESYHYHGSSAEKNAWMLFFPFLNTCKYTYVNVTDPFEQKTGT
jgi:hypothetical protein